jgi:hypothetical protein
MTTPATLPVPVVDTIPLHCNGTVCAERIRVREHGFEPDPTDLAAHGWSPDPMSRREYLCPSCAREIAVAEAYREITHYVMRGQRAEDIARLIATRTQIEPDAIRAAGRQVLVNSWTPLYDTIADLVTEYRGQR